MLLISKIPGSVYVEDQSCKYASLQLTYLQRKRPIVKCLVKK